MQKREFIGRGMTAEVYSLGQDKVLKLYFDGFHEDSIKNEAEIGCAVYEAGIPSPAVYNIVDEECRKGIIFQHIAGRSMLKLIETKPWKIIHYARQMARLHLKIHSCSIDNLPSPEEGFKHAIKDVGNILEDKGKRILDYFESLPKSSSVCHGDFHPDNILVTEKDMVAIDWNNAYSGYPLSDVALYRQLLLQLPWRLQEPYHLQKNYLKNQSSLYFGIMKLNK